MGICLLKLAVSLRILFLQYDQFEELIFPRTKSSLGILVLHKKTLMTAFLLSGGFHT